MPLTNNDLKKIKNLLDANTDLVNSRIDRLEFYMNQRFTKVDIRFDNIERKIDQLIKTEDEDIQVAYHEIKSLKLRLARVESKLGLSTK